ncbi:MAG: nucleoside triphosphate pyrophosphohydrolase [Actinomycetota bacterium]
MSKIFLVQRGSGAPEWCALEVWQALSGRPVLIDSEDPFMQRLEEAGIDVHGIEVVAPKPPERTLKLAIHSHSETPAHLTALANDLADAAAQHDEIAFVLPLESDAIVRAVLERALKGDIEVEVVVGASPRGHALLDVVRTMARLRGNGGCPWDAEQTHQSLAKHLLDESYELLHAIEEGSAHEIADELGDVLLQVIFHAQMGFDEQTFDIDDVAVGLNKKLITRHPHVFADVEVSGAAEVVENWDAIKEREHPRKSVHDDIPEALPALAWAAKLQRRAGKAGFDWDDTEGPLQKVMEELQELQSAKTTEEREHELGDLLLAVVSLSRHLDVDAESALRRAARRFRQRVAYIEQAARAKGSSLRDLNEQELTDLWAEAKKR